MMKSIGPQIVRFLVNTLKSSLHTVLTSRRHCRLRSCWGNTEKTIGRSQGFGAGSGFLIDLRLGRSRLGSALDVATLAGWADSGWFGRRGLPTATFDLVEQGI